VAVPEKFRQNILDLHGPAGADWLARVPELLDVCVAQWSLSLGAPYADSSYSYVVRVARADGTPAVLKLSFPSEHVGREAAALRAFAGRGSVALFAYEASAGAILLERAEPGMQLAQLCQGDDERATSIAADVVRTLDCQLPSNFAFPSVETWLSDARSISERTELSPVVRALVSDALAVASELVRSSSQNLLLHGDLHQFNILAGGETWLAIDPSGIVGERECEIGPLILNPVELLRQPGLSEFLNRRLRQLCDEVGLDRRRAHAWSFVRAVLAILWSLEDHGEAPEEWIACSQLLRQNAG